MGIGAATNTHTTLMEADDDVGGGGAGILHVLVMSPDSFLSLPLPGAGTVDVGRSSRCPIRLEDPLASREHARLHVQPSEVGVKLMIEDLGSANGTRVRDRPINPDEPTPFLPGEAITIGSTVLMVQQNRPAVGLRRLWSHGYFESRLEDECARAATTGAAFALARVRITGPTPWTNVVPAMVRTIPLPHLFAAYGPRDYEILFVEIPSDQVMRLMDTLAIELRGAGIEARHSVAWYPSDGRSADALLARANALVRQASGQGSTIATTSGVPDPEAPSAAGMERIRELGKRAAGANINVLILGETGVGKDVLARTIHGLSGRRGRIVALNCAGLSPTLIESELFGHEKGAFSGATGAHVGLLEAANGGTVFLDEIGEMPQALQSRLLRTIETREVLPVGATRPRGIDVRFVAATNRDLEADVLRGAFRQDLFFRLNGITLAIPPLRERTDEIPTLVRTFIQEACREMAREPLPMFTPEAMDHLLNYPWPGNIRELKNVIERALVLCDGLEISSAYLPLDKMKTLHSGFDTDELSEDTGGDTVGPPRLPGARETRPPIAERTTLPAMDRASLNRRFDVANFPPLDNPVKSAERQRILEALAAHAGNQTRAARFLGMPRRTFVTKLEQYGIPRPQKGGEGS